MGKEGSWWWRRFLVDMREDTKTGTSRRVQSGQDLGWAVGGEGWVERREPGNQVAIKMTGVAVWLYYTGKGS